MKPVKLKNGMDFKQWIEQVISWQILGIFEDTKCFFTQQGEGKNKKMKNKKQKQQSEIPQRKEQNQNQS